MNNFKKVKAACYGTNVSMAVVATLSPILFLSFKNLYGISYSLLGALVLINFFTQLTVDLIFSFFSYKIDIPKAVKFTPFLAVVGLVLYGVWPFFFPQHIYAGLVIGTILFSAASGFAEVLISPVIAAIPSENPDKEMSKLHSIYAWGCVFVVIYGTLFLNIFGYENWQFLAISLAAIPLFAAIMFAGSTIPEMEKPDKLFGVIGLMKSPTLWLCVFAIFLGGASECTMAQWSSGYLEMALGIPKVWGDIFGVALFAIALGTGRTLYANYGKRIETVLFAGALGASLCYVIAALSPIPIFGLLACAATGFFVSMLWPGSLIVASEKLPQAGVFLYAMMAAGGDFGASVGPQMVGVITDSIINYPAAVSLANSLGLTADQLGMKIGVFAGSIFPLVATFVFYSIMRHKKESNKSAI